MRTRTLTIVISVVAVIAACGSDDQLPASQPTVADPSPPTAVATINSPGLSSAPELFPSRTPSSGDPITIVPGDIADGLNQPLRQRPLVQIGPNLIPHVSQNPEVGREHIANDVTGSGYTESPATSGPHWFAPITFAVVPSPARWGVYELSLPDEVLVHNIEHGGVGIHYNCPAGCADLIATLENLVPPNRTQFIMSPYLNMDTKIAITAWRHHMYLDQFDEPLIREFIATFQDKAPESILGNTF